MDLEITLQKNSSKVKVRLRGQMSKIGTIFCVQSITFSFLDEWGMDTLRVMSSKLMNVVETLSDLELLFSTGEH